MVYIYRGTEGGLFPTPSQRLTPPTGSTGHFGYAITGGFDVDKNGYPGMGMGMGMGWVWVWAWGWA